MTGGTWRRGMATSCGECASTSLTYQEDGAARCNVCGAVTQPIWFTPASPVPAATSLPSTPAPGPTLTIVSPPPPAAPATPLVAYRTPKVAPSAGRDLRQQRILVGAVFILVGLAVTVGTYNLAASSSGGGTYFIAFGPLIYGLFLVARGVTTPAGIPALRYRPPATGASANRGFRERTSLRAASAESSTGMATGRRWPLVLFLVGLGLFVVGLAITPTDYGAGEAIGLPGFFALLIAPIWWVAVKALHRFRKRSVCAVCGTGYPAEYRVCPKDGAPLQPAR